MGKRGPKPVPTALAEKRGSWRAAQRKARGEIVEAPVDDLAFPQWCNPNARKHWNDLIPLMDEIGLYTKSFSTAAVLMVNSMADYIEANKEIQKEGWYTENGQGTEVLHPRVRKMHAAWAQIIKGCALFGLSPADRAGLAVQVKSAAGGKKTSKDEDEEILKIV